MRSGSGRTKRRIAGLQHCSNCGKIGHNSRTCQNNMEMDDKSDSE